jgi:hypothetical protein
MNGQELNRHTGNPVLSVNARSVRQLVTSFREDLVSVLGRKLIAIYLFGSIAFPGFEPRSGDIDFYVLFRHPLTPAEKRRLQTIHHRLSLRYRFGKALDGFYIPLTKARRMTAPTHLDYASNGTLRSGGRDNAWALHRQHLRKEACLILYGPKPKRIVQSASWHEIQRDLNTEFSYAKRVMHKHPSYAILNLCRLIYSHEKKQVVISKIQAAKWAEQNLPIQWKTLIRTALKVYQRKKSDQRTLRRNCDSFLEFASERIAQAKHSAVRSRAKIY